MAVEVLERSKPTEPPELDTASMPAPPFNWVEFKVIWPPASP